MIAWLESKAVSLLLVALLLVGGFGLFYFIDSKLANAKLATTEVQLSKATTSLATLTTVFSNYQAAVIKDQASYQALQDSINKIGTGVKNVNQAVKNYKPTAVLDDPWPADFIRLRSQDPRAVPANTTSSKDKEKLPSPR